MFPDKIKEYNFLKENGLLGDLETNYILGQKQNYKGEIPKEVLDALNRQPDFENQGGYWDNSITKNDILFLFYMGDFKGGIRLLEKYLEIQHKKCVVLKEKKNEGADDGYVDFLGLPYNTRFRKRYSDKHQIKLYLLLSEMYKRGMDKVIHATLTFENINFATFVAKKRDISAMLTEFVASIRREKRHKKPIIPIRYPMFITREIKEEAKLMLHPHFHCLIFGLGFLEPHKFYPFKDKWEYYCNKHSFRAEYTKLKYLNKKKYKEFPKLVEYVSKYAIKMFDTVNITSSILYLTNMRSYSTSGLNGLFNFKKESGKYDFVGVYPDLRSFLDFFPQTSQSTLLQKGDAFNYRWYLPHNNPIKTPYCRHIPVIKIE